MGRIRAHVIISGKVQGVGYRAWTRREATTRKLNGWVRNLDNGAVEAMFEGEEVAVSEMVELTRKGPRFSKVVEVQVSLHEHLEDVQGFEIRR